MALVMLFLAPAVIFDLRTNKIPNLLILAGYVTGFFYQGICRGYGGVLEGVLGALFPLVVLFPVFHIRGLGAGDLKLLSLAGIFLTLHKSIDCLIGTIFLGGIFAIFKMLYQHNFKERMQYLICYANETRRSKKFGHYAARPQDAGSKLHMSIPILCSALLCLLIG